MHRKKILQVHPHEKALPRMQRGVSEAGTGAPEAVRCVVGRRQVEYPAQHFLLDPARALLG